MSQAVQFDLPVKQSVQVLSADQFQVTPNIHLITEQMQKPTQNHMRLSPPDCPESESVPCFCFDIRRFSDTVQFTVLTTLVMLFFLVYGYMQEWIFGIRDMKSHGWFVTLVQFTFYSIMSFFEMNWRDSSRMMPLKIYAMLALCQLTTMGFSNASLGYLNYPTQVVFKVAGYNF
ncbi:adenosine 3'-phospho 5'-phosphosulfate transporter 2-like isoform X2 [Tigriopus californicus]|uniref:adenosine 3'-phospho 5'-phosphosulfate transporter 2-like isoform X2 n=1 Tax=Tigriopus californicus TaxID=6832 RepID=UPI0027DA276D|nr:adenosine 3'-phospho 5'-phosphosulfate transporter 2-like isoform X2 [Tigriopus californicus]